MDLFDAIELRRSIRQFRDDSDISNEDINKILSAGLNAPSAGNYQSWRFDVVYDNRLKYSLSRDAGHQQFISQAHVVIVVSADLERAETAYGLRGRNTYAIQETAAAMQNMFLAVTALGLAGCWIGAFDERKAASILELPNNFRPLAMLPIGLTDFTSKKPPKRSMDEVVFIRR